MKKITCCAIACLGFALTGKSQGFYQFQQTTKAYSQLNDADTLSVHQSYPNLYSATLPFSLSAYDEQTGTELTIGAGGFIVSTGSQYSFAFDIFLASVVPESGHLLMKWDTLGTDQHLIFEWRDFKLEGHPVSDYVNFKTSFNLQNQIVEFHYGPSEVTASSAFANGANTGPQVIVALLSTDFNQTFDFSTLEGDPSNPIYHNTAMSTSLNAAPDSGTVYLYVPANISLRENEVQLEVYPNPVKDVLKIDGLESGTLQFLDLEGKQVCSIPFENNKARVGQLSTGYYVVSVLNEEGRQHLTLKIFKE